MFYNIYFKMAVCKKNMKSITVFIKKMDKQTKKDTETVDTDKNQDKKDEKEENKDADKSEKPVEEEKKKDEKVNGEAENCEKKKDEKGNGEKKKDEKGNGEKKRDEKGNGEKEKEDVTNETKDSDEFRVCGVSVSDDDGSYEIGNLAILGTSNPFQCFHLLIMFRHRNTYQIDLDPDSASMDGFHIRIHFKGLIFPNMKLFEKDGFKIRFHLRRRI